MTYASLCQDVMILDQSVLFGVADIHDRHRDMRLDVDNMSYEVIDTPLQKEKKNIWFGIGINEITETKQTL